MTNFYGKGRQMVGQTTIFLAQTPQGKYNPCKWSSIQGEFIHKNLWTSLPNALTCLRILLGILFPFIDETFRLAAVLAALATEYLDGALSRRFNLATPLGRILDPIADKLFFLSVAVTFVLEKRMELSQLLLLSVRDLTVTLGVLTILIKNGKWSTLFDMKPLPLGKVTTALQYAIFFNIFWRGHINPYLFYGTSCLSILAAIAYVRFWKEQLCPRS